MNIATGDLAAQPASREELQGLVSALYERLRDAEDERDALRKWAAAMPPRMMARISETGTATYLIDQWMRKRPEVTP